MGGVGKQPEKRRPRPAGVAVAGASPEVPTEVGRATA